MAKGVVSLEGGGEHGQMYDFQTCIQRMRYPNLTMIRPGERQVGYHRCWDRWRLFRRRLFMVWNEICGRSLEAEESGAGHVTPVTVVLLSRARYELNVGNVQ